MELQNDVCKMTFLAAERYESGSCHPNAEMSRPKVDLQTVMALREQRHTSPRREFKCCKNAEVETHPRTPEISKFDAEDGLVRIIDSLGIEPGKQTVQ